MNVRDFWIQENKEYSETSLKYCGPKWYCSTTAPRPVAHNVIHVREVVPIDWDKIWKIHWDEGYYVEGRETIEVLVESAIKGQLTPSPEVLDHE